MKKIFAGKFEKSYLDMALLFLQIILDRNIYSIDPYDQKETSRIQNISISDPSLFLKFSEYAIQFYL